MDTLAQIRFDTNVNSQQTIRQHDLYLTSLIVT